MLSQCWSTDIQQVILIVTPSQCNLLGVLITSFYLELWQNGLLITMTNWQMENSGWFIDVAYAKKKNYAAVLLEWKHFQILHAYYSISANLEPNGLPIIFSLTLCLSSTSNWDRRIKPRTFDGLLWSWKRKKILQQRFKENG